MPKDIHVEPEKFAAELISRLEGVLREREAQEKLEERLKRVRLVSGLLTGPSHDGQRDGQLVQTSFQLFFVEIYILNVI